MAPLDYYMFPMMKEEVSGRHFANDNYVNYVVGNFLEDQDASVYKEETRMFHARWTKCVNLRGDFVEK